MLVELSVMEQRYQAIMAVIQDGWKVTEVAQRLGVARQSVHNLDGSAYPNSRSVEEGVIRTLNLSPVD